jgi:hypothetical protein
LCPIVIAPIRGCPGLLATVYPTLAALIAPSFIHEASSLVTEAVQMQDVALVTAIVSVFP